MSDGWKYRCVTSSAAVEREVNEKYNGVRRDWSVPNVARGRVLKARYPDWGISERAGLVNLDKQTWRTAREEG